MRNSKFKLLVTIFTLSILVLSLPVFAKDSVDPNIPDSWYQPHKTASEMGITEFHQSPMLDEKVANGELPPVEERLPKDPPVLVPYNKVGKYGGTLNIWTKNLAADAHQVSYFRVGAQLGRPTPNGRKNIPFLAKSWEHNKDYTKWTVHLRKGIKWSDGKEFTTDDYKFWYKYVVPNRNILPPSPFKYRPLKKVTFDGKYTINYYFTKPSPKFSDFTFHGGLGMLFDRYVPAHYAKQFHPDFVDKDQLMKKAEEAGFNKWENYYNMMIQDSISHPEWDHMRPQLAAYIAVERTETYIILERNPYYPFVDTEGNQLPYIDRIRVNLANSAKMAEVKAATGEATFAARNTGINRMPLYKKNAKKEDYRVLLYDKPFGNEVAIQLNLSHKDPEMRKIFNDFRFRKALSYAIDRQDINKKVFYGTATPMQSTVPPTNKFYKEKYAKAYIDFKPEQAKKLLDEMGMKDVNGDGWRERPDGKPFEPVLMSTDFMLSQPVLELVVEDMKDVGLNVTLKNMARELVSKRRTSNDFDIGHWSVDCQVDLYFGSGSHINKTFAPTGPSIATPWSGYGTWLTTDGKQGMEPPQKFKQLHTWAEQLVNSASDEKRLEAGRKLVKSQAENLWTIGTVSLVPQPIIVSNKLHNIPKKGLWDASLGYMALYNTEQFYLDN